MTDIEELIRAIERLCVAAERNGIWGGVDPRDLRAELSRFSSVTPDAERPTEGEVG